MHAKLLRTTNGIVNRTQNGWFMDFREGERKRPNSTLKGFESKDEFNTGDLV